MTALAWKTHKMFDGIVQFWEHESVETKTKMKFSTFIPDGVVKGCVIWLSGLTCTEENFTAKAGAQKYFSKQQLMVICPDTSPRGLNLPREHDGWDFGSGASFYLDATTPEYKDHYKMESYITIELVGMLQSQFKVPQNKISIMGHSMGGHGAIVLALRHPELFQSVSAFSPVSHPTKCPWGEKAFTGYLGADRENWKNFDATELVNNGKKHLHKILIDQGLQDEFLEKQLLVGDLDNACHAHHQGIETNYHKGYDHSYYFIAAFIESHISFHAKALLAL
ncbi:MAG: S-formylglutathione hydrolase [Bacteriovorax sp.]|nr:S-formylglutathione hydrolase [Bacteriovorax sp.]